MRRAPLALALIGLAPAAAAEPLSADRPGVANAPDVVGRGVVQLESGIAFERETDGDDPHSNSVTVPNLLLRVGVLDSLELRFSMGGWVHDDRSGARDHSSVSDVVISSRLRLGDQQGLRPATALELSVGIPSGSSAVTSDGVDPTGVLLLEWSWSERWVLDVNLGLGSVSQGEDVPDRAFRVAPAVALGTSLGERWGAFVEYAGDFQSDGVDDRHAMDAGLTWQPSDDLQLDVVVGAGLNDAAPDVAVGMGVVWRFAND